MWNSYIQTAISKCFASQISFSSNGPVKYFSTKRQVISGIEIDIKDRSVVS